MGGAADGGEEPGGLTSLREVLSCLLVLGSLVIFAGRRASGGAPPYELTNRSRPSVVLAAVEDNPGGARGPERLS